VDEADLILFNTCSVREKAQEKSLQRPGSGAAPESQGRADWRGWPASKAPKSSSAQTSCSSGSRCRTKHGGSFLMCLCIGSLPAPSAFARTRRKHYFAVSLPTRKTQAKLD
jgi:hypothetical protein